MPTPTSSCQSRHTSTPTCFHHYISHRITLPFRFYVGDAYIELDADQVGEKLQEYTKALQSRLAAKNKELATSKKSAEVLKVGFCEFILIMMQKPLAIC